MNNTTKKGNKLARLKQNCVLEVLRILVTCCPGDKARELRFFFPADCFSFIIAKNYFLVKTFAKGLNFLCGFEMLFLLHQKRKKKRLLAGVIFCSEMASQFAGKPVRPPKVRVDMEHSFRV